MSGLELNKIVAAVLLASLIAMLVSVVSNVLYKPNFKLAQRGYSVDVTSNTEAVTQEPEVKIDIAELMKSANAENGKKIVKKCASCHSFEKDAPSRVGPNLWNVTNRHKATASGYKYSAALTAFGGKWDDESLYHFLNKPQKLIPGTKMSFAGLSKPQEIADVIIYLKTVDHD